jgi:hypothetical protein
MKKYLPFSCRCFKFTSCTVTDDVYVDTPVSQVFEVPASFTASNYYSKQVVFNSKIFCIRRSLVYRLTGSYQGKDTWKLLPEAHYYNDGTFDFGYEYDYSVRDVTIYLTGNDLATVPSSFRLNQILQIVIVPGSYAKLINKNDYGNVMSILKLKY